HSGWRCCHLALCPNNKISGGKILRRSTRKSANRAREILQLCAQSLLNSHSALGAQPIAIHPISLALTPSEIHSNDFDISAGGATVASHIALQNYTSKSPVVEATLRAPNATLQEVLAIAKAYGISGLDKISGGSGTLNLDLHAS